MAMSSLKCSRGSRNGEYSSRGLQSSRKTSQHMQQGYQMETIAKFMKSSKASEHGTHLQEHSLPVEDVIRDDIEFIRSEVFKEIEGQKPYSCIIENTLTKLQYDPLKLLFRELLQIIEKEEERIKRSRAKLQKSRIDKKNLQKQQGSERKEYNQSLLRISNHLTNFEESIREQGKARPDNPEQLREKSLRKDRENSTIECEDRISQKRFKQLKRYIAQAEKKRDQLNVELTNLEQLYGIKKSNYLKSKEENKRQKHKLASHVSESAERNRLEEEQKERFLDNLKHTEELYNKRRQEISLINQQIQELQLEEDRLKQKKSRLSEEIQELNQIIETLDRRIDGMNKQLTKLHTQYGRESAHSVFFQNE